LDFDIKLQQLRKMVVHKKLFISACLVHHPNHVEEDMADCVTHVLLIEAFFEEGLITDKILNLFYISGYSILKLLLNFNCN